MRRVLLVSKAVEPPFRDGAACIVRDLAPALGSGVSPTVLTSRHAPSLGAGIRHVRLYRRASRFAPGLLANARVAALLATDRSHDLWHFIFAPNPASSSVATWLRRLRRRPVVQTVASRPRTFRGARRWLFGDRIVTLSRHTADGLILDGAPAHIVEVVRVPVADVVRDQAQAQRARQACGIRAGVPLFVYPGDLETSSGADTLVGASARILQALPDAELAIASRMKTPRARERQEELERNAMFRTGRIRFVGQVDDLPALMASCTAVVFPVDDLYGKVDHPYAVLEACLLGVPPIVATGGPLDELGADAPRVRAGDVKALASACIELASDTQARRQRGAALRAWVLARHDPARVAQAYEQLYVSLLR